MTRLIAKQQGFRLLALSAAALLLAVSAHALAAGPGPERTKALIHLVRQDCGSCNGMTLKGGLGKPLLPENLKDFSAGALAGIILDGVPDTPMPPWRGELNESDALWIAHKLKEGFPHEAP
jgi:cytochrome c55X